MRSSSEPESDRLALALARRVSIATRGERHEGKQRARAREREGRRDRCGWISAQRYAVADRVALLEESGKNCACGADEVPSATEAHVKAAEEGHKAHRRNGRIDDLYKVNKQY